MKTKAELLNDIAEAKVALAQAEVALDAWSALAENNVFSDIDTAIATVEDELLGMASKDCEGSYNCGADKYERDFMVDGKAYTGTLTVEYNRHDKTYYYVDGSEFAWVEKAAVAQS